MCRIFGQFGQEQISELTMQQVALSMKHGGPDQQSFEIENGWALGNDRLAIQGIDGGEQPFVDQDGICVVFNGEIYNHHELRQGLIKKGFSFTDKCDGNVIAPLFQLYGSDFVKKLDGMFAIAVIHSDIVSKISESPKIHLFTDPAGMKSLYIHIDEQSGSLSFASEIDGLVFLTKQPLSVKSDAIFDYLSLRAVCGEISIFEDVITLGPARHLEYALGEKPQIRTYKSTLTAPNPSPNLLDAGKQFQELLDLEIQHMLSADVPVCVVTSGGLDSTLISAIAARHVDNLHSFHVCYKGDWPHDERVYARKAADMFGTIHHEIEVDPDDFPDIIQRMVKHIGQPNTAPHSLSSYSLFEGIHDAGFKVAVTGEGADELFGGYERFGAALEINDDWISAYMDKFGPFAASLRGQILTPDFYAAAEQMTSRVGKFTQRIQQTQPGIERLDALQGLDQWDRFPYYILRRADHLSMAHAVEVRIPFCQPKVLDFARKLPLEHRLSDGKSKRVVYEAARGLIPQSIMERKKQPFTLPVIAMIKKDTKLFDFMASVFKERVFKERGYFDAEHIMGFLEEQAKTPNADVANMLWSVMVFELWHEHIDQINAEIHQKSVLNLEEQNPHFTPQNLS